MPLRARRELVVHFPNRSQASPSSISAFGAIVDAGERVTMDPTMIWRIANEALSYEERMYNLLRRKILENEKVNLDSQPN